MDKEIIEPTSNSSQGSRGSRGSQQGAPNPYKKDLNSYTRPVAHERSTRAPKAFERKDSRGSDATYQKALEAVSGQESSSDDRKRSPASAAGSNEVNQQVINEGTSSQRAKEMDVTSQKDVRISPVISEQVKDSNLTKPDLVEQSNDEKLDEQKLGDVSLDDDVTVEDLFESPMQYEEMMRSHKFSNEESYLTDDDVTMNMSFRTAMKDAVRAEGVTAFSDIPEHRIERTQTGKIINVRSPSPNSPTSNLWRQIRELQTSLEGKECQLLQKKQEYQRRISSLETHVYEMEQQQGILENAATEWKIRYERQKEIAEEAQKVADDKEVEKFIAVDELNESMSEETAEKSRRLAELKDQCDELRKKANEAEIKRNEYANKLAEATQRLAMMSTDMLKLRNDLKLKEENIGILQKESQAHQKRADDALQVAKELTELGATEGERLKNEIKKVIEENNQLTEDGKKAAEEGLKWRQQALRLDTMVTALEIAEKENQQKVHEQLEENIRLNTELTAMATTAMLREDEATEVRNQLISAGQAYTELEQQVNQLAERMITLKDETHKEMDNRTIKLQNEMLKIKQDNDRLRKERDELNLKNRRLEDENIALQVTNKHKDEQLLQFGAKKDTDVTPPPSYSKTQGTGAGGSAHFEMPLRTGGGRGDFKTEKDDEVADKRNPSGSHQPQMSSGDPSQYQQPIETAIKEDANRDARSPRHEHDGRYFREIPNERNQRNERNDRNEDRVQREFNRTLKNMGRKTDLAIFDGNPDAVNGWIRIVKETQRTYDLTDEQIMIDIASAVRGPAKIWFDSERDIEEAEEEVYTVTEWLNKFKDEYSDRNEEVLGFREAMARKFKPGKETLEQFYQAIMKFKAKKAITELQAVAFLIDGCRVDNNLYNALKTKGFKTPAEIKAFFRSWAAGEDKYKVVEGQRNQPDIVTIRSGQVEMAPRQYAAAPVQQVEYRPRSPVPVQNQVTFNDSQTGQPITYAMVAAIQAQAQARPVAPANVMPHPLNVEAPPQQGRPNNGNQYGNGNNWNNGQGNGNANLNNDQGNGNFNQNRKQGNYQQNRGNYQPQQGSRTEWKFGQIDG
ncbi:uncharacterized protein LOC129582397 [Paramacrobiotus metropolitanus]|uniref:uncharacterized protein LOC129582397 n=1 Tax=Paramacrobiotus metropolitanus TaxID=2943436 RepID=UPI00244603C2|nr:uncharacterized protein LOC129582397 [Paramacrobiotus metropolitanus]